MTQYKIHHKTEYIYSSRVSYSHHLARLSPYSGGNQKVLSHWLDIKPNAENVSYYYDYYQNQAAYFSLISPHDRLEIHSYSEVEVHSRNTPQLDLSTPWETVVHRLTSPLNETDTLASEFKFASKNCPISAEIAEYAKKSFTPGENILKAALNFNKQIHEEFTFDPKATNVTTSVHETFKQKKGVCQDYAHFQISALRSLGLAAKYVSGYLRTDPPPGKPRLVGADASHAWVSLYIPEFGWVEYDSTNNVIPSDNHIIIAYGRDYDDICPIRGVVYGGGSQKLNVGVTVTPMNEFSSSSQKQQQM